MPEEIYTFECLNCHHHVQRIGNNPPSMCDICGAQKWTIIINLEDWIRPYDELEGIAQNKQGEILSERIYKTDLNINASLTADKGQPSKISISQKQHVTNLEEEGRAAQLLVEEYNALRKTKYAVEEKTAEDSECADRVLVSVQDKPERLII